MKPRNRAFPLALAAAILASAPTRAGDPYHEEFHIDTGGYVVLFQSGEVVYDETHLVLEREEWKDLGGHEDVDVRAATLTDSRVEIDATGDPARFVASDGTVKAMVGYRPSGPGVPKSWRVQIDMVRWQVGR